MVNKICERRVYRGKGENLLKRGCGEFTMIYKINPQWNYIRSVMFFKDNAILDDVGSLQSSLEDALNYEGFNILGTSSHKFNPHGCTIVAILSESHATIHTNPEKYSLVFDLLTCRGPQSGRKAYESLRDRLGPYKENKTEQEVLIEDDSLVGQVIV